MITEKVFFRIMLTIGLCLCLISEPSVSFAKGTPSQTNQKTNQEDTAPPPSSEPSQDFSAPPDVNSSSPQIPEQLSDDMKHGRNFLTDFEYGLTLVILLFGALVLLAEYLLLRHAKKSSYELMQLFAVNLIITGTLVLISAGYSAEQIAPAMGLFGTIAGYLLGRRPDQNNHTRDDDKDQ